MNDQRPTPAVIICGTSSGSGKTTITLGLMAALRSMNLRVQPFKCGPDFIDPGLHRLASGRTSRNLDLWMCGEDFSRHTFQRHSADADIAVVEGVMGMFDGGLSSSAELAKALGIPAILVLDVRSMAESAAAIVKGFENLDPEAAPRAVILNRIGSERHLQLVSDAIRANTQSLILGHLPRQVEFSVPSRHLGLLTAEDQPISDVSLKFLAETIRQHIDMEALQELSTDRQKAVAEPSSRELKVQAKTCRIGVARDKAFCFYYQDNLELLEAAGAELIFFSPLTDRALPANLQGLYLGGGYPELYAAELAANKQMVATITAQAQAGLPIYAECGGFMYLTEGITDQEGKHTAMTGIFPARATMQKRRASLGYRQVETTRESMLGPAGTVVRGHEFHYSAIDQMGPETDRCYQLNNGGLEGYSRYRVLGGYIHLHFGSNPAVAHNFVDYCGG